MKLSQVMTSNIMICLKTYGFLQKIKDYINWVNAESLDNMSSSNFQSLINKIREVQGRLIV